MTAAWALITASKATRSRQGAGAMESGWYSITTAAATPLSVWSSATLPLAVLMRALLCVFAKRHDRDNRVIRDYEDK